MILSYLAGESFTGEVAFDRVGRTGISSRDQPGQRPRGAGCVLQPVHGGWDGDEMREVGSGQIEKALERLSMEITQALGSQRWLLSIRMPQTPGSWRAFSIWVRQ